MANTKTQLIKKHLARPALNLGDTDNPQVIAGQRGQTHGDIMRSQPNDGNDLPPNVGHGFMTHDGQYLSREQAREHLMVLEPSLKLGSMEPDSMDLAEGGPEPIYSNPDSGQTIYHFGGGRGASVVRQEGTNDLFELAAIKLGDPAKGPYGGFTLDYTTMAPQVGLTLNQVHALLTKLQGATPNGTTTTNDGI